MNMFKSKTNLSKPIKYMVLIPILQSTSILFSCFILFFDYTLEISTISIVHYYAQLAFLSFINFPETNNIWVL